MVKLIIGGSTGFVGTEIIRQALANPAIQSIVGLSRRQTVAPEGSPNTHKLRSVIVDDFENYSESTKKELEDADACIWYVDDASSRSLLIDAQDHCRDALQGQGDTMG
jgi:N-acetyl-gamma-glutamylphosphate reductase